jgi:hypothetical protein
MVALCNHRRLDVRLELEVHSVPDVERAFRAFLVCLELHALLSTKELLLQDIAHGGAFLEPTLQIWRCTVSRRYTQVARSVAI